MQQAEANLEALGRNPYPGRGIILGVDQTGSAAVQVYWIMGRSANSRNRVFMGEGGRLWTEAADPSLVKDPSLIIYTAMDEVKGHYVVTNGDQTDTITEAIKNNRDFEWALMTRQYEPDAPNFTPRISGLTLLADGHAMGELAVLKHSEAGESCNRNFFTYEQLPRGLGYCVTTYQGDGDPFALVRRRALSVAARRGMPRRLPKVCGIGSTPRTVFRSPSNGSTLRPAGRASRS